MAFYLLSPAPGIWRMVHKEPAVAMGDTYLRGLMHESRWISKYSMKLIKIGYVMIINTIYIYMTSYYIYILCIHMHIIWLHLQDVQSVLRPNGLSCWSQDPRRSGRYAEKSVVPGESAEPFKFISGWWFGTWILFFYIYIYIYTYIYIGTNNI